MSDLDEILTKIAEHSDEAIGNTGNREGDAYQQGMRDLAVALLGREALPDRLRIGDLESALEGGELQWDREALRIRTRSTN